MKNFDINDILTMTGPHSITGFVIMFIGILYALAGSFFLIAELIMKLKYKVPGYGEVISLNYEYSGKMNSEPKDSREKRAPVIWYRAAGKEYIHTSLLYRFPCKYKIGDPVKIYYNAAKPENILIEGDNTLKRYALYPGVIGLVLIITGIVEMFAK